jgi:hypothetical protein
VVAETAGDFIPGRHQIVPTAAGNKDGRTRRHDSPPVKRNRYLKLTGATKSVNRDLETKTRALAGLKGYADGGVMPTGDGSCLVGVVPGLDCSA